MTPPPPRPPTAVITALNLNGLGVARTLGRHGVRVIGMHSGAETPELQCRYVREVWRHEPGEAGILDCLVGRAAKLRERAVLMPITDESVTVIAKNLDAVQQHYSVGIQNPQLVLELLSKKGIAHAVERLGIRAPKTVVIGSPDEMAWRAAGLRYPCVMKSQTKSAAYRAAGGRKAYLVRDAKELLEAYHGFCDADPRVVMQEFIPGGDRQLEFCLMYVRQDGRIAGTVVGRKIRQWPPVCGGLTVCEPIEAPDVVTASMDFVRRVGLTGLCSVEYKRDPRDGSLWLLEPTVGRPDWQNAVADANGVPLAYMAYCDLVGHPIPDATRPARSVRWANIGADLRAARHYRLTAGLSCASWAWSVRPPVRFAYLALDDIKPGLAMARGRWSRIVNRLRMIGRRA